MTLTNVDMRHAVNDAAVERMTGTDADDAVVIEPTHAPATLTLDPRDIERAALAMADTKNAARATKNDSAARIRARELKSRAVIDAAALAQAKRDADADREWKHDVGDFRKVGDAILTTRKRLIQLGWVLPLRTQSEKKLAAVIAAREERATPVLTADEATERAELETRLERLLRLQSALYARRIRVRDLATSGRFFRNSQYHNRDHGGMAFDHDDMVMRAVELSLLNPETHVMFDGEAWPTVGGMYRNLKRASAEAIDSYRAIRAGGNVFASLDELMEAGVPVTPVIETRLDHYGRVVASQAFESFSAEDVARSQSELDKAEHAIHMRTLDPKTGARVSRLTATESALLFSIDAERDALNYAEEQLALRAEYAAATESKRDMTLLSARVNKRAGSDVLTMIAMLREGKSLDYLALLFGLDVTTVTAKLEAVSVAA